jgi:hypothetical protein
VRVWRMKRQIEQLGFICEVGECNKSRVISWMVLQTIKFSRRKFLSRKYGGNKRNSRRLRKADKFSFFAEISVIPGSFLKVPNK